MAKEINLEVVVEELRGHHLLDLFCGYFRKGEFIKRECYCSWGKYSSVEFIYTQAMLITDSVDTMCKYCRTYPAINLCKGKTIRLEDHKSAAVLGIIIGLKYTPGELESIFKEKVKEFNLERNSTNYILGEQLKDFCEKIVSF